MKDSKLEELALKAVLSIEKQKKCLLFDICSKSKIECDGERKPWCELEKLFSLNKIPDDLVDSLASEKIIQVFQKLNKRLGNVKSPPIIFHSVAKDFPCPFFRFSANPCRLYICCYYSSKVETGCMLSIKNIEGISLSEFSVGKGIQRERLLKIVFGLVARKKWEMVEAFLREWKGKAKFCPKCEHFISICEKDKFHCKKRSKIVDEVKLLIPESIGNKFPAIAIILATSKVFGKWYKYFFSNETLRLYLKFVNSK